MTVAAYRLGVDIGGTFTDFVLVHDGTGELKLGKTLTTPSDPADGVISGLKRLLAAEGLSAADLSVIVHGTTLATNAIIERTGAPTGLLTTSGFVDVLAIGRETRYNPYDLQIELPKPLVPRPLRRGVVERIDRDGNVRKPLDREQLAGEVATVLAAGVQSVAVSYLHSYKNPSHEQATAAYLAETAPDLLVSCSSDVLPELREYERTSTTVINAYLQPIVERYVERLERRLHELGFAGAFHLVLSSGLLSTAEVARRYPVRLIESGPVGGSMLGGYFSRLNGRSNLITFDMGGTTAKASLIHDGRVPVAREFEVGRIDRFRRGSGFPVRTPAIDMEEIGAGGGSIASIDRLSQIQVGPRSAGADPGPACYGLGGTEPTVTDADLVLGYLDPDYFLGGEMRLDRDAAAGAIEEKIARPLGLHLVEAAWGIHRVVNEEMANAFRIHALEHGRDAARYALLCFGGAGPVHAYGVGQILRSPAIISPASAGVASALGFLVAPVAADFVQSYIARLDRIDWGHLNDLLEGLEARGRAFLATAGIHDAAIRVSRSADMQHVGQMHDIPITVPLGKLGPENENELHQGFLTRYRELFQRTVSRVPVEALTWRVTLSAPPPEINLRRRAPRDGASARKGERLAYFAGLDDFLPTAVYDRYALQPGDSFPGPAIVEERESTLVVGPAAQVSMDDYGSLLVETGVTA